MSDEKTVTLPLAELGEGTMRACTVGEREVIVCRTKAGVFVLDNICTHAFARLSEGRLRGTRIICPLHGASFDVRDGRVLGAPATQALATFPVRIDGERVEFSVPQPNPRIP